eukprot:Awhi_evm1s9986
MGTSQKWRPGSPDEESVFFKAVDVCKMLGIEKFNSSGVNTKTNEYENFFVPVEKVCGSGLQVETTTKTIAAFLTYSG